MDIFPDEIKNALRNGQKIYNVYWVLPTHYTVIPTVFDCRVTRIIRPNLPSEYRYPDIVFATVEDAINAIEGEYGGMFWAPRKWSLTPFQYVQVGKHEWDYIPTGEKHRD